MTKTTLHPLIIIGTGLAGYNLAKEIRKLDKTRPMVLITQDDGHFYSKPQLSNAIVQGKTPQGLIISDVQTMQAQLNATIYPFTTVTQINTALKTLTIQNSIEQSLTYENLVLALGAQPKPFKQFDALVNHYRVNNLQDYGHFIDAMTQFKQLAIMGSGLVGCEFAHDLSKKALQLTMISPDPYPLANLVPPVVGETLRTLLTQQGINCLLQTTAISADNINNGIQLRLSNQNHLTVDAVLSAIGLNPQITLAQAAGVGVKQGIVVDDYLQTTQPHVYALGDCAEIHGRCHQYIAPILQCARVLARTLGGELTPLVLQPVPISLKVQACPTLIYPAPPQIEGEWRIEQQGHNIKALYVDKAEHLRGFVLTGSANEARQECLKALQAAAVEIA